MMKEAMVTRFTVHILQVTYFQKLSFNPKVVEAQQPVSYWQKNPQRWQENRLLS